MLKFNQLKSVNLISGFTHRGKVNLHTFFRLSSTLVYSDKQICAVTSLVDRADLLGNTAGESEMEEAIVAYQLCCTFAFI